MFNWGIIDDVVEKYLSKGYKFSFRITSKETGDVEQIKDGVQYATPEWVKAAGAVGTVVDTFGVKSWVPDWDDPIYLSKLDNFHRAFAARYDAEDWMIYVDVGSIGDWGEGHTAFSIQISPEVDEVKANIDVYIKHYKYTQIVVSDDLLVWKKTVEEAKELYDYVVNCGGTLRDDSPMVDWSLTHYFDTWSVSHPHLYESLYRHKPIILEMDHYSHIKQAGNWKGKNGMDTIPRFGYSGAYILRKALTYTHASYIGFHGDSQQFLEENPLIVDELGNLCGYWFFPVQAAIPPSMLKTKNNRLVFEWFNKGVAPAYNTYSMSFLFESTISDDTFEITIDDAKCTNWLPQQRREEDYIIPIPSNVKNGEYMLKFKLKYGSTDIQIGLSAPCIDENGYAGLGVVSTK